MLIWTNRAKCDLLDIQLFFSERDARAGLRLALKIARKAEVLIGHPKIGRKGLLEGTREWPIPGLPFLLVYQAREDKIEILHVVHQALDWP